jgi:hypothetical protein
MVAAGKNAALATPICAFAADVGPALEQLRGQAGGRHRRRRGLQRRGGEREARGGFAEQHRDGVFQLRALQAEIERLRARGMQLGFGLRDVGARHHADAIAVLRQFQRLRVGRHRRIEQLPLRVQRAQLEVVLRQFRLHREARVDQVGGARLLGGFARFHRAPHLAPEVRLPGGVERRGVDDALGGRHAHQRAGGR